MWGGGPAEEREITTHHCARVLRGCLKRRGTREPDFLRQLSAESSISKPGVAVVASRCAAAAAPSTGPSQACSHTPQVQLLDLRSIFA